MPTPRSDDDPILLAADHNGVAVKQRIKEHLVARGRRCLDLGPFAPEPKVDYCDYAFQLGHIVDAGEARRGILVCGTGVGMSIVANRFARVRAALVHNLTTSMKSREHNDANVLCLGAWITAPDETLEIVDHWIDERFGEGRHVRRLEKIAPHDPKARVLTYGIFDLVNAAHIELLKFAKSLGGRLIVGINSDAAVRALRGPDAPVNREGDRKKVVESLIEVDEAIVFEEVEPRRLIATVRPDVIVKGDVGHGADAIRARDGIPDEIELRIFPRVPGYSSRETIERIRSRVAGD